jgi:hypothetical protein
MTKYIALFLALSLVVVAAGCFPSGDSHLLREPAGFLMGIWHGWIAPISLIVGIFDRDVRIYESNNTGWWYDFGYYMAIIAGFGGLAFTRRKKKHSSDDY